MESTFINLNLNVCSVEYVMKWRNYHEVPWQGVQSFKSMSTISHIKIVKWNNFDIQIRSKNRFGNQIGSYSFKNSKILSAVETCHMLPVEMI